jgi:CheY-like chemotaxis protein
VTKTGLRAEARLAICLLTPQRPPVLHRVILVDDSEGEALLVKQMLRDAGLEEPIYWIGDSRVAINYLSGEGVYEDRKQYPLPEIILLDLGMPGVDGYQFLRWLRCRPEVAKIFVVVLTAEIDPKRIQLAYQLGANSYLAKGTGSEEYRNFVRFLKSMSRVVNLLPRSDVPTTLPSITPFPTPTPDQKANSDSESRTGEAQ